MVQTMEKLTITIHPIMRERMRSACEKIGNTQSAMIRQALDEYLTKKEEKNGY